MIKQKQKVVCLVTAAGVSNRVDSDIPKQYMEIGGKPLIRWVLERLSAVKSIDSIGVIYNPEYEGLYKESVEGLDLMPPIIGGKTRQESIRLGLEGVAGLSPSYVLLHDAARPFFNEKTIDRLISELNKEDVEGCIPVLPVEDTLKEIVAKKIRKTVDRAKIYRAQTPQAFAYNKIFYLHQKAKVLKREFTDDAAIFEHSCEDVKIIEGDRDNFKITNLDDIEKAGFLMQNKVKEIRVGMGFDVHKFCEPKRKEDNYLTLCGVRLPFEKSLKGHSDADVALHAITDAILGSISEGDIGVHFPPSDDAYKDMDSAIFLDKANSLVKEKNGKIINVDLTIICERPKISLYSDSMRNRVAEILSIDVDRVSVKATTTEKLGFTGRREGIAAQAICNVELCKF